MTSTTNLIAVLVFAGVAAVGFVVLKAKIAAKAITHDGADAACASRACVRRAPRWVANWLAAWASYVPRLR